MAKILRKIVNLGSISIFYRDTEVGEQSILCLHGRWGRGETWIDFISRYSNIFRIIAPDQRGHGLSEKPESTYSVEEMADDMIRLIDHLGIGQTILIGHSMGGHIAGYIAANYPKYVKKLAILDKSASGPQKIEQENLKRKIFDPITENWEMPFSTFQEAEEQINAIAESELSYRYFMNSLIETADGYQMMFSPMAMARNIAEYTDWFDLLPKIQCRTTLIRAKGSEAVSDNDFIKMRKAINSCNTFDIDTNDHNVHLANKVQFYKYMDRFLDFQEEAKLKPPRTST